LVVRLKVVVPSKSKIISRLQTELLDVFSDVTTPEGTDDEDEDEPTTSQASKSVPAAKGASSASSADLLEPGPSTLKAQPVRISSYFIAYV